MGTYLASTRASGHRSATRVCPECSGLECLCRPRFFAGQLLTEQELNRLDRYIIEKNKLHNRYLHGWGVVCGLDVVCDGCGSGVIVKPGYALAPCGDDIVVCHDAPVDVCDLINQCTKKSSNDCGSPNANDGCAEATKEWVLAICYEETSSRGVMPLKSGGSSGCGCGCGGSSGGHGKSSGGCGCGGGSSAGSGKKSGGCGCGGGSASANTPTNTASRKSATQCEPTIVCEGYRFCVYPAPKTNARDEKARAQGAMAARFTACLESLTETIPAMPSDGATAQDLQDWCCATKEALLQYIRDNSIYNCELAQRINQLSCVGSVTPGASNEPNTASLQQLMLIMLEIMLACMCRALQPPCPEPVMDNCVPLAVVTVRNDESCKVVSICNWTTLRKYAITFPNLQYWLSIFPFGRMIREALESFCCNAIAQFREPVDRQPVDPTTGVNTNVNTVAMAARMATAPGAGANAGNAANEEPTRKAVPLDQGSPASAFRAKAQTAVRSKAFMRMAMETLTAQSPSLDARSLTLGLLGETRKGDTPYLSTEQSDNLLQFLVLDQMAKPAMRAVMPEGLSNIGGLSGLGALAKMMDVGGTTAKADTDLTARVDALGETVKKQQAMIDQLTTQLKAATGSSGKKRNG